ncbi:MAG: hypothetical protein J5940_01200 [Clostridia bacterium]|nr:hypothetical protein [Clostridia bacterium]
MAKTLEELFKEKGIPEAEREDFLRDPANRAAIEAAGGQAGGIPVREVSVPAAPAPAPAAQTERKAPASEDEPETAYGGVTAVNAGEKKAVNAAAPAAETASVGGYTYYRESAAVTAAREALAKLTEPTPYSSAWQSRLSAAADKILNRKAFSYDYTSDPVYAAYSAEYQRLGRSAMENARGTASAYTGGYSNSYAESAANAAYQNYISKLADKLPELYALALKRYDSASDAAYDEFGMLRSLVSAERERYDAEVASYEKERDYLAKQLDAERDADLKAYSAELDAKYKSDTITQKAAAAENELRYKAEQAEADRALALEKLDKELEYKASADRLKYAARDVAGTEGESVEDAGADAGADSSEKTDLTLNGIKNEFYSLLTAQGSGVAFIYIDGLVSNGKLSIQAARNVLSECGALDAYLARKRGDTGSQSGASAGRSAYVNVLM